ncbi:MAG: tol-pal system protein YbgF [Desulfobacteraceae bacterium 4572_130]|nr:MAG: tol-pal system protein YbgF [Desulfobacteraceae bacterium 4572_130]
MKKNILGFFCIFSLFLFSGCIMKQDIINCQNRITTLEINNAKYITKEKEYDRKINSLLNQFENDFKVISKSYRDKYARIKTEINTLKNKTRVLTGKFQELEYKFPQYGQNTPETQKEKIQIIDNAISKNYQRLLALEKYIGFEKTKQNLNQKTKEEKKNTNQSEQELYKHAKENLDSGDNDKARTIFEQFLTLYPESDNVDNAMFWIADSYYKDEWYEKSILEYQKVIEKYPNGNKVAAALLKQGCAFAKLGEKANAKLILKELIKKYPDSNEIKIAKEKLKNLQ